MRLVVVKNGRMHPGLGLLAPGDVIASWWWDADRLCHVIEITVPGVPASAEVSGAGWDCDERGHRHVRPNGVPTICCVECGECP